MTLVLWFYFAASVIGGVAVVIASIREKEYRAAWRLGTLAAGMVLPYFVLAVLDFPGRPLLSAMALAVPWLIAVRLLRQSPPPDLETGIPESVTLPRFDERDVMFSRAVLVPGTGRYVEYYSRRPDLEPVDGAWRRLPGLLSRESLFYDPGWFASAEASFRAVAALHTLVENGGVNGAEPANAVDTPNAALAAEPADPAAARTDWLLRRARALGAVDAGVTRLRTHHLYSHVGRGAEYGNTVDLSHPFALALTVEMDRNVMQHAPHAPVVAESARQYFRCGAIAVQLAEIIRELGYTARAHIDANYRVICPLVARDAGLGEIGRMGLLMTPRQGPRVRIAVVTTDMPLAETVPDGTDAGDPTVIDFCRRCRKCADVCPGRAIPFDDRQRIDGALRWRIDAEACFTYWCRAGTDCGRCMAVCPYAHPDGGMHALVRWGIRRNDAFRRLAVRMDDWIYGRQPPSRPMT
ncbi:MAG TPA: 4Fe-4S dicluster domain-containing protein [bacterium]|nr:4Fe-4S dicluster domain-containing protein [bacterium]